MNFKKNWKRFWTLSSAREGFTLVELIVVIAILAILAGVAVPAYSGYVTKANKQADMTLASEVAHALTLYYYAHPGTTGGYVVLAQEDGTSTADAVGAAAMQAALGENWATTAVLKYDGWTGGLLDIVAGYSKEELELIANSSYLTTSTPASLMNAVTSLTGMAHNVISGRVDDLDEAMGHLETIFGADSDIVAKLEELKVSDSDDYTTVISNLLVNEMAGVAANEPVLQEMMNLYAAAYAYGEATGEFGAYDAMTAQLQGIDMNILSSNTEGDGLDYLLSALDENNEDHYKFMCYMDPSMDPDYVAPEDGEDSVTKFENDMAALGTMMGAVQHISNGFTDKDSLLDANLFTTDDVMAQVNAYYNSVKSMDGLYASGADLTALQNASDGSIVVFIAADGSVAVVPGEAYPVSN